MLKAILSGCCGRMGKVVSRLAPSHNIQIVAGLDIFEGECNFPLYKHAEDIVEKADVIIDFSNPTSLPGLLVLAKKQSIPLVISTTGYSDAEIDMIKEASLETPIFWSANMSLGINLLAGLAQKAASVLGDSFDIEIIEKHHNQKIDAPSGTALMLADRIKSVLPYDAEYVYERQSRRQKRSAHEIGIHAIRGGTIVGEHEIIFAGTDEILSLKHQAMSRDVLAVGALKASKFVIDKHDGLYNMIDLVLAE